MKLYDRYILPQLIQCVCGRRYFDEFRQTIVSRAYGQVLEIGIGAGANLPYYQRDSIKQITALEPSVRLLSKTRQYNQQLLLPLQLSTTGAENIPLDDHSIDNIVTTFSLCSIADLQTALQEMKRVLKPNGQLLYCEHGLSPEVRVQRWQHRLTPLWKKIAGGCHLNRDFHTLLQEAGFHIKEEQNSYYKGPRSFSYFFRGCAQRH